MHLYGAINSVFIMSLTKQQLIDAHKQGLSINTKNGNIKIVAILNDIYGVNHFNSNKVQWWMFENFERNQATIEQHKPKIDLSILKEGEIYYGKINNYEWVFKVKSLNKDNIYCITLDINSLYKCKEGLHFKYEFKELSLPNENQLNLFYSQFPELKPKPKYNGRAVKCESLEQILFVAKNEKTELNTDYYLWDLETNSIIISISNSSLAWTLHKMTRLNFTETNNIEIISFSQYCTENGITEPRWIQGFEVGKDYNDVVFISDSHLSINTSFPNVSMRILKEVREHNEYPFKMNDNSMFAYARYPRKEEINEIKFSN